MPETLKDSLVYPATYETVLGGPVCPIAFGTARFGAKDPMDMATGYFPVDETDHDREIELLVQAINRHPRIVVDTARAYGNSENRIGDTLKIVPRNFVLIITKVGIRPGTREFIRNEIDESVRRIGTPPDIIMMHTRWEDGTMKLCIEELLRARKKHQTYAIGVSNLRPDELRAAIQMSGNSIAAFEVKVNIVNPRKDFLELMHICREHNIPFFASSALDRSAVPMQTDNAMLARLSQKYHMSLSQLGIRAVLETGAIPIVMSHSVDHLNENLATLKIGMEQQDASALLGLILDKVYP